MKTIVAGVGSVIRTDDGVGIHAARLLAEQSLPPRVEVIELGTAGLTLLDTIETCDRLLLLDAILSGATPGTVHLLEGDRVTRAAHLGTGHEADLPTTLSLGRKILGKRMPREVAVLAIEAQDLTTFSETLTPSVEAALPEVIARAREWIASGRPG